MPGTKQVTVSLSGTSLSFAPDPVTVTGPGATTIVWVREQGAQFTFTGLTITPTNSGAFANLQVQANTMSVVDTPRPVPQTFKYAVWAVSGGQTVTVDPQIVNQPGPDSEDVG